MGTVFLAEVPVIEHQVALKILSADLHASQMAVARFEREAKLLSKLDHRGLVPLYSYGQSNGLRYLVMKAINGVSLSNAMAGKDSGDSRGSIVETIRSLEAAGRPELLMSIARQLAEALKAVHAAEVLHRDIKPSNILVTDAGQVFLTDFSLAKIELPGFEITRSDEFVGTLRYCAPESLDGVYSKQGDIYSLGLVLFELFSLTTPFESSSRRELLNRKMSGVVPELAVHGSSIPEPALLVLRRMMQYDPAARYQTADEVFEALELCFQCKSQRGRMRRRATMLAVAAILLPMLVALVWKTVSGDTVAATNGTTTSSNESPPVTTLSVNSGTGDTTGGSASAFGNYAVGHDPPQSRALPAGWLIPGRYFQLPNEKLPASHVSLSEDGTHLVVGVDWTSLYMGLIDAPRLLLAVERPLSKIVAIDQSEDGDLVVLVNRDSGRPRVNEDHSESSHHKYFVETFAEVKAAWTRIPGPFFQFSTGMPRFILGPSYHTKRNVLIPEAELPVIWQPFAGGFLTVPWPDGLRSAVSCYFDRGAVAMRDGTIVLLALGVQNSTGKRDPSQRVQTPVTDCRTLQHSLDGQFVVAVGQREACVVSTKEAKLLATLEVSNFQQPKLSFSNDSRWLAFSDAHQVRVLDLTAMKWHGETLHFDDTLLLATPMPDSLLTAEQSGRVRQTSLADGKSELIHEFQAKTLTAATFSVRSRRLVLATADARVSTFTVP